MVQIQNDSFISARQILSHKRRYPRGHSLIDAVLGDMIQGAACVNKGKTLSLHPVMMHMKFGRFYAGLSHLYQISRIYDS